MSELVRAQQRFTWMYGQLINETYRQGYAITQGEIWRTPEQAALNASKGLGIKNSLHCDRLAADLNIWKNGALITPPQSVVAYWETLGGAWGGHFGDPSHFSLGYHGRK
jgi:hypothetical protein